MLTEDGEDGLVGQVQVALREGCLVHLPGHQVASRDGQFFLFAVTRELDDLEAVTQSGRDGVQSVGRGHEHDV